MKLLAPLIALAAISTSAIAEVPKIFSGLFQEDKPVKGQLGMVMPPEEITKYLEKVRASAEKNPEWFKTYSAEAKPGIPLPYHENLGLTKQEYQEYLALWNKRSFKSVEDVLLILRKRGDEWTITASGEAGVISTLRYSPKKDVFTSPSGELKRIEDINADENSVLGAWKGHEWKLEDESGLSKAKYNFAIGQFTKTAYGLLIYRAQEVGFNGRPLMNDSIVVRFPLGKAGLIPEMPAK